MDKNYGLLTKKAIPFAIKAHEGQTRKSSNLPYVIHPIEVFSIVKKYKESRVIDELLASAILHDTIEDCDISPENIKNEFGELVCSIVMELTNDKEQIREKSKQVYLDEKLKNMSSWALVIKLADILANSSDQPTLKSVKRMKSHIVKLKNERDLSETHLSIVKEIERVHKDFFKIK